MRSIFAILVAAVFIAWASCALALQGSWMAQQGSGMDQQGSEMAPQGSEMAQQGIEMAQAQAVTLPQMTLFEPNGGEVFRAGSRDTVRWSISDSIDMDSVNIYYSIDGGKTFPFKVASLGSTDSTFVWLIPNTPSTICRVRVVAFDSAGNQISAMSDSTFAIAARLKRRVHPFSYMGY